MIRNRLRRAEAALRNQRRRVFALVGGKYYEQGFFEKVVSKRLIDKMAAEGTPIVILRLAYDRAARS